MSLKIRAQTNKLKQVHFVKFLDNAMYFCWMNKKYILCYQAIDNEEHQHISLYTSVHGGIPPEDGEQPQVNLWWH